MTIELTQELADIDGYSSGGIYTFSGFSSKADAVTAMEDVAEGVLYPIDLPEGAEFRTGAVFFVYPLLYSVWAFIAMWYWPH